MPWVCREILYFHDRVQEVSLISTPWKLRNHALYLDEVSSHLVRIEVRTPAERDKLGASLCWLKDYPWGRRVSGVAGQLWGLKANDQLVVTDSLRNPHDLETMQPPFHVFFFRPSTANSIVGVSLVINIPGVHNLGIEGFQIEHFAECTLHTLDLGVAQ